ncbi:MAG: hypothetical protein MUP16_03050 [Sedimentisphaerales bacterium]|nr:hypothetical protein [Sedimentisphaerales bacterium]
MMMPSTVSGYMGEIAGFVAKEMENSRELLQESNALSFVAKGTFQQLHEIFRECSFDGWGGDKAKPISEEVFHFAIRFLNSFPLGMEAPEVGAEPDGAITLEWYRSPNKVISISINPDGWMYYAALIGTSKRHGADFSLMGVSDDLVKIISQVVGGG